MRTGRFALASTLLVYAGCSSAPLVVSALPEPPDANPVSGAPRAPKPPQPPGVLALFAPTPPAGRLQTLAEVVRDLYRIDSVPHVFPVDANEVIAVSVPEATTPDHRAGLIGAFLASGYRVKDAGEFRTASFHIDDHPRSGTAELDRRTGSPGVELASLDEGGLAGNGARDGFAGMKIQLHDPTSLWAPDLVANQNLEADHFLRLFRLKLEDVEHEVKLSLVFDREAVERYRSLVDEYNDQVEVYNRALARYHAAFSAYTADHTDYVRAYEAWKREEEVSYSAAYASYHEQWSEWRAENEAALAARESEGPAHECWQEPGAPREWGRAEPAPIATKSTRTETARVEPARLDGSDGSEIRVIPSRRLALLAELVDTRSGQIAWVGEAVSIVPEGTPDSLILRETIQRVTR